MLQIGAPLEVNPWLIRPDSLEQRRRNDQMAATMGVPAEWGPYIHDFPDPAAPRGDARIYVFQVGLQAPARSLDELLTAASAGLGFDFIFQPGFDLREIRDVLAQAPHISIGPLPGGISGWGTLASAEHARVLHVSEPSEPLLISHLPNLQDFSGVGTNAAWGALNPNLKSMRVHTSGWPSEVQIAGQVQSIYLEGATHITRLPALAHPDALAKFRADELRSVFDLTSFAESKNLIDLELNGAAQLVGARALLALTQLERLEISDARSVDDPDALSRISSPKRIIISPNYLLDDDVAGRLQELDRPDWYITDRLLLPDEKVRARFNFVNDEDSTTFEPFVVHDASDPGDPYLLVLKDEDFELSQTNPLSAGMTQRLASRVIQESLSKRASKNVGILAEDGQVIIDFPSLKDLETVAKKLTPIWNEQETMATISRFDGSN